MKLRKHKSSLRDDDTLDTLEYILDVQSKIYNLLSDTITIDGPEPYSGWTWYNYASMPMPYNTIYNIISEQMWRVNTMFWAIKGPDGTLLWTKRFTVKWTKPHPST